MLSVTKLWLGPSRIRHKLRHLILIALIFHSYHLLIKSYGQQLRLLTSDLLCKRSNLLVIFRLRRGLPHELKSVALWS